MASPYVFLKKMIFFSHRPLKTDLFVLSSPLPSSHVVYPVFVLNSATKISFIRVSPPGWCHPGKSPASLPSDANTSSSSSSVMKVEILKVEQLIIQRAYNDNPFHVASKTVLLVRRTWLQTEVISYFSVVCCVAG